MLHRIEIKELSVAIASIAWLEIRYPTLKVTVLSNGVRGFALEFVTDLNVDLDFLRPYVLPPRN